MEFREIVAEYKARENPLSVDEIALRANDDEWIGHCFRCDACDAAILHDDELYVIEDDFLCERHVDFDDNGDPFKLPN